MDFGVIDKTIKTVKTDDFALYFELENGECLIHYTGLDGDGNTYFSVKLLSKSDFDLERQEWYNSDINLKEIK